MKETGSKKHAWKWAVRVLIILVVSIGLNCLLTVLYSKTGMLIFYFFKVWYDDSLNIVIFFLAVFIFVLHDMKKEGEGLNLRKAWLIFSLIALSYITLINFFKVSKKYGAVVIDDKTPSKFVYKCDILLDMFSGDTETEIIPVENIDTFTNRYVLRSTRKSRTQRSYYITYTINNSEYSSLENYQLMSCIEGLKECVSSIEIEYYPHSGIIKSINGINKNDIDALAADVIKIQEEADEKRIEEEKELLRLEEEEKEKSLKAYRIMEASTGRLLSDIQSEFEENDIEFSCDIIYISSQMYNVNEIAFYDEECVWVVSDNSKEDLVVFPKFNLGMTRQEIIDVLTDAGLSYECEEFSCDLHKKNTLHTIGFSYGETIPKGYTVWFSVDK